MASLDETDAKSAGHKRGKKAHMADSMHCLMFARDNLPSHVYSEFVKTMTGIWKQCADPDGEIRSICAENCIETAMKLFQDCALVKQSFLDFTQGRSPIHIFDGDDADVDIIAHIESPLDFLRRAKACPDISEEDNAAMLQTLQDFYRKRTMTPREVFHIMECMRNCPQLVEEFTNNYLPPDLKALVKDEKSGRNLKTGQVGEANLCFTSDANQSWDDTQIKVTNKMEKGSEEWLLAEEDEEDTVKPLPDWITSRWRKLPPKVEPENCAPCTPSYYLLPHNCKSLRSSYRTKLGRSILNDALVSHKSIESLRKARNKFEDKMIICEDDMFESDMLLQRFRETAYFIANLQDRVSGGFRIIEHITPLHRRCIKELYNYDPELDDLLESQNTSAALSILLSRLKQRVEILSDARLCFDKILSPLIAENYYRSLDHRGPSFKQLDSKRMGQKALLAEAKEIQKSRLNVGDEYANPEIHNDISRIISSLRPSDEKLMTNWTEIVHPFLSAKCLLSHLKEAVAPSEACEHCGISKDFLSSSSGHGFGVEIEEGELLPNVENIETGSMLGPGEGPARASRVIAGFSGHPGTDTSIPNCCDNGNESVKKNKPRQLFKRTTKPHGVKGDTCCSLAVLCRLYQILYKRLETARGLCTGDLYTEFKDQLCRLLDHSIHKCSFEDFCLKYLGPNSFELFTLDIVITRFIKQLFVISSSDSLLQFLETSGRPIRPRLLSPHRNPPVRLHDREEQDGKVPLHFERRKKRKMDNGAASSSQPAQEEGTQTPS